MFFLADRLNSSMVGTVGAFRLRILAGGDWRVFSMSSSSTFESLSWACSAVLLLELSLGLLRRYFHFLTVDLLPNAYRYRSVSSAFSLVPSGSSKATEREEAEP